VLRVVDAFARRCASVGAAASPCAGGGVITTSALPIACTITRSGFSSRKLSPLSSTMSRKSSSIVIQTAPRRAVMQVPLPSLTISGCSHANETLKGGALTLMLLPCMIQVHRTVEQS
jgi:hypothetical protein